LYLMTSTANMSKRLFSIVCTPVKLNNNVVFSLIVPKLYCPASFFAHGKVDDHLF